MLLKCEAIDKIWQHSIISHFEARRNETESSHSGFTAAKMVLRWLKESQGVLKYKNKIKGKQIIPIKI